MINIIIVFFQLHTKKKLKFITIRIFHYKKLYPIHHHLWQRNVEHSSQGHYWGHSQGHFKGQLFYCMLYLWQTYAIMFNGWTWWKCVSWMYKVNGWCDFWTLLRWFTFRHGHSVHARVWLILFQFLVFVYWYIWSKNKNNIYKYKKNLKFWTFKQSH